MKQFIILTCQLLIAFYTLAGEPKFPVSAIPEDLKSNADVVIREKIRVVTILSDRKMKVHSRIVLTILNSRGASEARFAIWYDKFKKVSNIKGAAFSSSGEQVRKFKSSEVIDKSYSGGSLFTDNRIKVIDLRETKTSYPYTVEFEYDEDFNYLYSMSSFAPIEGEKTSCEFARYEIIFPDENAPRYKTVNVNVPPVESPAEGGMTSLKWEFSGLKPVKEEQFAPEDFFYPIILAAPASFEYAGYRGNMSTWRDYGSWGLSLNEGRDNLPAETIEKIKTLTRNLPSVEEKAKVLYEFMQNKTRYVYIEKGIGGLQPFDAKVVDENGYGDCKALSNYMVTLLKYAGIRGFYTDVQAGDYDTELYEDFPSHQSNHVIVAVPNGQDTLWLECTSQTTPFAYQGGFTADRKALMLTETGGVLVNTTRYSERTNKQQRIADVKLDANGNAFASVETTYSGLQYENGGLDFVVNQKFDDQKKWLEKNIKIPTFDIKSFSFLSDNARFPKATVSIDLVLNRLATVNGKRIFLLANLMNRMSFIPEKIEKRQSPVVIKQAFTNIDTVRYELPDEIYTESLPETISHKSIFGEYEAQFIIDQNSLIYVRKFFIRKGTFPAESYNEMIEFYRAVTRADNTKVVFLNKT
ncbi:MAG TPA: DUF3857 domain-containing protein [Chryseosolibacter sp.]|nr:DUF3857 domain-containing protein [Chryseosolibacter sp.]